MKRIEEKISLDNKRIQNFDFARSFAIICVVLCHAIETAYSDVNYKNLGQISQIFRISMFTIGRLGVPIFLFLTGALILKKQIETDEDVLMFYKKNLFPLFITIEIWNILYNIFNLCMIGTFNYKELIYNVLFLKQVDMSNMWYMPMILGMYIAIPFIAKLVKTFKYKSMQIPMKIVFLTSFILPSINNVLNIFNMEINNLIIDLSFLRRRIWIIYIDRILYI